jgi:hypothetical protein
MNLHRLSDDSRRRLSVLVLVALMAAAAMSAGVLGAFGRQGAAETALAIALAASLPVLAGTASISPTIAHRSLKVGVAAVAVVALLSLVLAQTPSTGA